MNRRYCEKFDVKIIASLLLLLLCGQIASAQNSFKVIVSDSMTHEKLEGVAIVLANTTNGALTDSSGFVEIKDIPSGAQTFEITYTGYAKKVISLQFPLKNNDVFAVHLLQQESVLKEVLVSTTRVGSRIEDAPVKIEVIGAKDLREESGLQPGNISSVLGDVSGVQIQQTSAVSSTSVVRMQGLDGRYTLLLRDGMPAYGGLSGGLNILQIPPLDLKQIEIIKGPASTLNGGGAIAGLINFISKEPGDSARAIFVFNQSSLLENNMDAYFSGRNKTIGFTFLAAGTHQFAVDIDNNGFSTLPQTTSVMLHPQLFFYPDSKTKIRLGLIANYENRLGGDMQVIRGASDSTHQYFEKNVTQNYGAELMVNHDFVRQQVISFRASINYFNRNFQTNDTAFAGGQWNGYSELYYGITRGRNNFIVGGNYLLDLFNHAPGLTEFSNYTYHTAGAFAQYSYTVHDKLSLQAGFRGDWHSRFGFFALPSLALLVHATHDFSIRINGGTGYKIPNLIDIASLNEDITSIIAPPVLQPERSYGGTVEWNFKKYFSDKQFSLFINQTFFYTWVQNAIIDYYNINGVDSIYNIPGGATTMGIDNYVRLSKGPVEVYAGYTFTYPRKNAYKEQPFLVLTPLNRGAAVITYQVEKHWKLGLECSVMGKQYLDDGLQTKPYVILAASVQYQIGRVTLVLNGENLLDERQTRFGPVVFPPYTHPEFAQIWAPLDGRVINLSVMLRIF